MTLKFRADEKWSKVIKSGSKWPRGVKSVWTCSNIVAYIFVCSKLSILKNNIFGVVKFKEKFAWNLYKVVWEEKIRKLMSVYNYLLVNALSIIKSKDTTKSKKLLQCKNFEPDFSLLWFRLLFDHQGEIQTVDHFRSWLQAFFIFRDFMSFRQADVPVYSSPDVLILLPNLDFASFSFRAPSLFILYFCNFLLFRQIFCRVCSHTKCHCWFVRLEAKKLCWW